MKTIINRLFIDIGLKNQHTDFGTVYYFNENNIHSYWMVIETENLGSIIENQSNYFTTAKELLKNEWFDKNANLLILYKQDSLNQINKNEIIDIEENPYLFKKQILIFTETEKQKLVEAIEESQLGIKKFIEKKILSNRIFEKHKVNLNDNDFESLIYRIAHKIPFINIKVIQENGLLALNESNNIQVNNSQYNILNDILSENLFDKTLSEIENLSTDEIYTQLLIVLERDED